MNEDHLAEAHAKISSLRALMKEATDSSLPLIDQLFEGGLPQTVPRPKMAKTKKNKISIKIILPKLGPSPSHLLPILPPQLRFCCNSIYVLFYKVCKYTRRRRKSC